MNKPTVNPAIVAKVQAWSQRVSTNFDRVNDRFDQEALANRVDLDESYFRAFVDFFAGEETMMYFGSGREGREKALATWINVAGGSLNEVNVTRVVAGKKELLFTVPAVYDRSMVEPVLTEKGKPSVYGAVVNANNIVAHSPEHAEHYLNTYLGDRLDRMWRPAAMMRNAEAWNKIFAFYGKPPLVAAIAQGGEKKDNGDISGDEVVGFDPL